MPAVRIAPDKATFDAALFTPGGTFDGYVRRRGPRNVFVRAFGEDYVLNPDGVFCLATKSNDGRTCYSYGGTLNARLNCRETADLAEQLSAERIATDIAETEPRLSQ